MSAFGARQGYDFNLAGVAIGRCPCGWRNAQPNLPPRRAFACRGVRLWRQTNQSHVAACLGEGDTGLGLARAGMGEAARLGLAEAIFFLATVGSHGVMALKSGALQSMTQDHRSHSTTGQTQARGNDRNFADTRTFRAHEGEYP